MKLKHKINHGWQRPSEEVTDSYQREIDASLRKAEKAWRKAQKAAERAERMARQKASPETIAARDEARLLVLQRLDDLRQIEELMRTPTHAPTSAVHRTGRQDRLEVGTYVKPKRKRQPKAPVKSRRKP
ncbi:hypothetical protein [Streptomyces sp. NPDC088794]|uniref:hypothetical protein n=1 Tax=Streptomyces sp. NPDC088794 TaxID=3365902 RepID=UPI00380B159D